MRAISGRGSWKLSRRLFSPPLKVLTLCKMHVAFVNRRFFRFLWQMYTRKLLWNRFPAALSAVKAGRGNRHGALRSTRWKLIHMPILNDEKKKNEILKEKKISVFSCGPFFRYLVRSIFLAGMWKKRANFHWQREF